MPGPEQDAWLLSREQGDLKEALPEGDPGTQEEQALSGNSLTSSLANRARKRGHRHGGSCKAVSHILPGLGKCSHDYHRYPQEGDGAQIRKGQGNSVRRMEY